MLYRNRKAIAEWKKKNEVKKNNCSKNNAIEAISYDIKIKW